MNFVRSTNFKFHLCLQIFIGIFSMFYIKLNMIILFTAYHHVLIFLRQIKFFYCFYWKLMKFWRHGNWFKTWWNAILTSESWPWVNLLWWINKGPNCTCKLFTVNIFWWNKIFSYENSIALFYLIFNIFLIYRIIFWNNTLIKKLICWLMAYYWIPRTFKWINTFGTDTTMFNFISNP